MIRNAPRFSSIADAVVGGNPMFDHRPIKPFKSGEDKGGGDNTDKQHARVDYEESWVSKHWTKISILALVTSFGLLYNYFQGYRNRSGQEDKVVNSQAIEPLEVNEIRMSSKGLTSDVFKEIIIGAFKEFPDGMCSYKSFVAYVLHALESRGVTLRGMHLIDRVVESYIVRTIAEKIKIKEVNNGEPFQKIYPDAVSECRLPVGYFLTVLNLALAETAPERVETLFTAAFAAEKGVRELESRSEVIQLPDRKTIAPLPDTLFVASSSWAGAKEGYFFGTGEKGTGYYRDDVGYAMRKKKIDDEYNKEVLRLQAEHDKEDVITVEAATAALGYLMDTCQIPGEKQVITTGNKYPAETFRKTTSDELMRRGRRGLNASPIGAHTSSEFTRTEFVSLVLGPDVCAWGECFRRR